MSILTPAPLLKIYYNNFWDDFDSESLETHNYLFQRIFTTNIERTHDYNDADILCESVFVKNNVLDKKPWKYSFLMSYEPHLKYNQAYLQRYTCVLSGFVGPNNHIAFPYLFERILDTPLSMIPSEDIPTKSVCSVISNPVGNIRNSFLHLLEQFVKVDHGGGFKNNIGYKVGGPHTSNILLDFYRQYKFVIAMENSEGEYYITEKIYNALRSGRVPIYWGSSNIDTIINPKRILHVRNDSHEEMMRVITRIQTMTDDEYLSMIREPIFVRPFDTILDDKIHEIQTYLINIESVKC